MSFSCESENEDVVIVRGQDRNKVVDLVSGTFR